MPPPDSRQPAAGSRPLRAKSSGPGGVQLTRAVQRRNDMVTAQLAAAEAQRADHLKRCAQATRPAQAKGPAQPTGAEPRRSLRSSNR